MFADRRYRLIAYHDTWISLDPIVGCPYQCVYCVLRHSGNTGVVPLRMASPQECVARLLAYSFFVKHRTPVAIGNETDMLYMRNVDYLVELLRLLTDAGLDNPVVLITKAPLTDHVLLRILQTGYPRVIFFLSYSGLDKRFEPHANDDQLRLNFQLVKQHGFRVVHYWRPLLPENTNVEQIDRMLQFVSQVADATVIAGLKIHPALTQVITQTGFLKVPEEYSQVAGEWLDPEIIGRVYGQARRHCPRFPLYRHASCALASVLGRPNHTGTVYRPDICPPSHCPVNQRSVCEAARMIPAETDIARVLRALGREVSFELMPDHILIKDQLTQEEFTYVLHNLGYPTQVRAVVMQNLYHGSIFIAQQKVGLMPPASSCG